MKTKMIKNAISMMLALLVFITIGLTACSTNKQNKVIIWAWDAYANAAEKAVELYKGNHKHTPRLQNCFLKSGLRDSRSLIYYDESAIIILSR